MKKTKAGMVWWWWARFGGENFLRRKSQCKTRPRTFFAFIICARKNKNTLKTLKGSLQDPFLEMDNGEMVNNG